MFKNKDWNGMALSYPFYLGKLTLMISLTSVNKGKKHKILSVPTKSISYFLVLCIRISFLEQTVNILIFYTYLICFKKKNLRLELEVIKSRCCEKYSKFFRNL